MTVNIDHIYLCGIMINSLPQNHHYTLLSINVKPAYQQNLTCNIRSVHHAIPYDGMTWRPKFAPFLYRDSWIETYHHNSYFRGPMPNTSNIMVALCRSLLNVCMCHDIRRHKLSTTLTVNTLKILMILMISTLKVVALNARRTEKKDTSMLSTSLKMESQQQSRKKFLGTLCS